MDFKQFDSDLTNLETQQKNQSAETQSNWTQILASADFRAQMVANIDGSVASYQDSIQELTQAREVYRQYLAKETNPAKKEVLTQIESVSTDLLFLYNLQIQIKNQTKAATNAQDVSKAVTAANDEDRMSLVISWHSQAFDTLRAQYLAL